MSDRFAGKVCALRGGAGRVLPPDRDLGAGLVVCFFDPKMEKMFPPLDFLTEDDLRRGAAAFRLRCLAADFISSIPCHLIFSSPTIVPLILTNHPWTVEDFSLP